MPEYTRREPEIVAPGETVLIDNRCENSIEIAAGVVFREDGDYIVSVRNGRITVCRNSGAFKEPTNIPPKIIEAAKENERRIKAWASEMYDDFVAEKRAEIERLKAEIARMPPMDYDKLAANPPDCKKYVEEVRNENAD